MELSENEVMTVTETEATEVPETTEVVAVDVDRPFMTTSFEDYSVTEGFLLLIFVLFLLNFFLNLLRR